MLCKFPIIIIVHLNYPPKWCGLLAAPTGCGWDMAGAIVWNCCQLSAHSVHYTINNRWKTGWKRLTCAEAWPAGMSACCVLCAGPCSRPLWDWTGGTAVLPTQPPATTNAATNCWLARHGNTNTAIMENSSIQDGVYAFRKAYMHSTLSLRRFSNTAFKTVPMCVWLRWQPSLTLILPRKTVMRFLFPSISPAGNHWCDVLGSVSSSSTQSLISD